MKKTTLVLTLLICFNFVIAQDDDESNLLPTTMFSVEGGYHYSSLNGKNGVELRSHVWFLRKNSIGPEFHIYAPSSERKYND